MDTGLLLILAGAAVFNLLIIYLIIKSAINSSVITRHAEIQTKLLAKMATKSGVTAEEIDECYR